MPLDESILGGAMPFDPSEAVDNTINEMQGTPQGSPVNPDMVLDRAARKILAPRAPAVEPTESKYSRAAKPDLSEFGVPADQEISRSGLPDFSAYGEPVETAPVAQPAAPVAAPAPEPVKPPVMAVTPEPSTGLGGDIKRSGQIGMNTAAQDMRELVDRIPGVGKSIGKKLDAIDEYFNFPVGEQLKKSSELLQKSQTPETQASRERKWWDSKKSWFGDAWSDPRSYMTGVVESLPEQAITMLPAMRLAKMAYSIKLAGGATAEVASAMAARTATIAGGMSEGALGGAQSSREVRDAINALPMQTLSQSDAFKALLSSGMSPQDARVALANDAATRAFVTSGVITGMFGGMGDRAIAKIFTDQIAKKTVGTTLKSFAKGAIGEGVAEELPQSMGQQLAQNEAMRQANPDQSLTDDVLNQGLGGMAVGALQGGAMGAGAHAVQIEPPASAQQPAGQGAAPAAAAPTNPSPPTSPAGPAAGGAVVPATQTAAPASSQDDEDYAILRQGGYSDENIADMSDAQRKGEVDYYRNDLGVDPAEAVKRFPRQTDDTGKNVPETPATLRAQQDQLVAGERSVQMFPKGTEELPTPPGMERVETPRGIFHYDPAKTDAETIKKLSADGRENELLGLGSVPKSEVMRLEGAGEKSLTVVERTPDGTEVRAAAGTESTIEKQRAEMEAGKSAGNTISIENTADTAAKRKGDTGLGDRTSPIKASTAADVLRASEQVSEPTPAQAQAENYKHGHIDIETLGLHGNHNVSIETGVGQTRKGVDADGKEWSVKMPVAYGRIKGTRGADGEPLDIFIGPNPTSNHVFIVDQHHPAGGGFDEHKILAGFVNPRAALQAYKESYTDRGGDRIGGVTAISADEFKAWLKEGDHTAPYKGKEPVSSTHGEETGSTRPLTEADTAASVPKEAAQEGAIPSPASETPTPVSETRSGVEGEILSPARVYAEPAEEHHQQIEAVLGQDYDRVLPADTARAAEILSDNPDMPPAIAFQHAVIENAVSGGYLTEQEAIDAYGKEVTDILEPVSEGAPVGGSDLEQGGTKSAQEPAGDSAETGVVSRGGEAGEGEPNAGVVDHQPDTGRGAADKPNTKRKAKSGTVEPETAEPEKVERIEDAGEKIGGARKDQWAGRGLTMDDLDGMTGAEIDKHVTKHNVWQKPDYVQAVADGVEPKAAALIKRIYDSIALKPTADKYGRTDPAELRKRYIAALNAAREVAQEIKTVKDVRGFEDLVTAKLSRKSVVDSWDAMQSVKKAGTRVSPFYVSGRDMRAAERMVAEGFPQAEPWTRLFQISESSVPDKTEPGAIGMRIISWKPEWSLYRKNGGRISQHETKEAAEAAAKAAYEAMPDERKKGGEEPKRPHLDSVERAGPDYRKGKDVGSEDFIKDFGFRGVEFGNWVAGDERQKVVNLAYDALHDLARTLNLPAKAMSLDGTLAVAFGARGKGGRAAAHYESDRTVINMTKLAGAGSLAHEWAHALDHYLGETHSQNPYKGSVQSITGWRDTPGNPQAHYRRSQFESANPMLPRKLRVAANRLMDTLFGVEENDAAAEDRIRKQIEAKKSGIKSWVDHATRIKERMKSGGSRQGLKQAEDQVEIWGRGLKVLERQLEEGVTRKTTPSNFVQEASKLSGTTGDYWRRPNELMARSFESYVFDKIADEGFKSQYLVQGVEPDRYGAGFKGNPYPTGDERTAINAAYDRLFRALAVVEGKHGAEARIQGAQGEPEPVETVTKVTKPQAQPTAKQEAEAVDKASTSLTDFFERRLANGEGFLTILHARRLAKEAGFGDDPKALEEAMEAAVVRTARGDIATTTTDKRAYAALVNLYGRQPKLATRTSTSVREQAYSTPVPLAFVAAKLAGITHETTVYEPTAGNGALLITADPLNVTANELNPDRAKNLRAQGMRLVTDKDATKIPSDPKSKDVVIANPPFGAIKQENSRSFVFDMSKYQAGYQTHEIDHAIALRALEDMKDDGRAVLLLGGISKMAVSETARSDAYNEKAKREFYKVLYDNYGVTDHFTVAGELYERQGAGWPVDVIVIEGRKKSGRALPAVDVPRIYSSWDALGGILDGIRPESASDARPAVGPSGVTPETGAGLEAEGGSDRGPAGSDQPGVGQRGGVRGKRGAATAETGTTGDRTGSEPGERGRSAGPDLEPAAERSSSGLTDDLDDILNDAVDAAYGPKETAPATPRTRTSPEVAKSAVKNAAEGADAAFDALHKLFGGNKASSGFTFDEDTYAKAKPLFEQAAAKFKDSWGDVRELAKRMVAHMRDTLKWSRESMEQALPYLKRFMTEFNGQPKAEPEAAPKQQRQRTESKGEETENQVTYTPQSKAPGLDTLVPVNMRRSISDALSDLESRVGPIDEFVASELKYTPQELEDYFGAEQVDALGLAIDNLKNDKGFIIGDQTGIGKGRVNAGIIRWAYLHDRIPIFTTEKPGLYADMYRDLHDIGMDKLFDDGPRILATNTGLKLPLDDAGRVTISNGDAKAHNAVLTKASGDFFKHHDMVFTNYSQMQTVKGEDTIRRQFLKSVVGRGVMIFDESHNAGGQTSAFQIKGASANRSQFARDLVQSAKGVFYSSATYAKRPDVMDLYSKTDMAMAVDDLGHLAEAISRGGVPMQQVVATMLADAGQYIRRERSFKGINYNTPVIPVDRGAYDEVSRALAGIQDLSVHVATAAENVSQQLKAEAGAMASDGAVGDAGASSTNFTAVMHNLINQLLLAMKVDPAAKLAIAAIERGEKPVLTVANTMESFLSDFADATGVSPGEAISADFSDVLQKYLDRTRTIIIKKPFAKKGETIRHYLTDDELGPSGLRAYEAARATIAGIDLSALPVSPIDHLKGVLEKAGYRVGEITGRGMTVDYTGEQPVLRSRPGSETSTKGRNATRAAFNKKPKNGGLHAIIINQAGSTGISMHSSKTFDDQSKRRMFIVQPEGNIDTHMQLLGRVNRTGQTVLPEYDQLVADIPAEKRPAAVLAKKMASLNANTTASRSSALTSKETTDFMNSYGDAVAVGYLLDNFELNARLAFPVKISDNGKMTTEDAMRRLTGRIPLLPLAEQEAVYSELESEYTSLIQQLEEAGENALEAKTLDLKAKTIERAVVQDKRNNSGSPFAAPVTVERTSIVRPGKPYKPEELAAKLMERLGLPAEYPTPLATLEAFDVPRTKTAQAAAKIEREERTDALKEFTAYTRPILDDISDADKRAKEMTRFNAVKDRFETVHQLVPIGRRVTLKTISGNMPGVVIAVERVGDAKNPLALGSWKATFAIPDATKTMTLPFSRIVEDGKADPESVLDVEVVPTQRWVETPQQTLERFANKQIEAREERYIATGNLLAAYDWLDRKGAIVNYTDHKGAIRQGILTPRDFELGKHTIAKGKLLQDPKDIRAWLDENTTLSIDAGDITIGRASQWSSDYTLSAKKAKRQGGKYYLDKDLTDITGDFYSRSGAMETTVTPDKIEKAIKRLQALGAKFKVPAMAPKIEKVQDEPGLASDASLTHFTPVAESVRGQIEAAVTKVVQHLVGNHVAIDFSRDMLPMPGSAAEKWSGFDHDGARGIYWPWRRLVQLSLVNGVDKAAYHESYHAIEYQLQSPNERAFMERETPNIRNYVARKRPNYTAEQVRNLAPEEVRAVAFEEYAHERAQEAANPGSGLHVGVRRFFSKLWDGLHKLANALRGLGFRSYTDIFAKAYEGGYANAPGDTPRPEASSLAAPAIPPAQRTLDTIIDTRVAGKLNLTEGRVQIQDKMARVKKAEQSVNETRASHSPYLAEGLYYGRTGERLEALDKTKLDPLVKDMHDRDLTPGEINEYLYARHAEERNNHIGAMHEPGTQFNDAVFDHDVVGASGMSTNEARDVIDAVRSSGKRADYDAIEARIRDIIDSTRQTLLNTGLISQETFDQWGNQYDFYVPLRGFAETTEDDFSGPHGSGGGMNVRGKEAKQAFGRTSTADGPLNYIMHQAMSAIIRGEKNRVGNTMLRFVQDNPDQARWIVNKPKFTHRVSKETGLITTVPDNFSDYTDPRVFITKIGGKPYSIRFEGPDGVNIARAMNNMGTAQLHSIVRAIGAMTRFLARVSTSWNPEFFASNFVRDLGEAFVNMQEADQRGFVKAFRKHMGGAMAGSMQALADKNPNGRYVQAFRELDKAGGRIRFFGLENPEDIAANVDRKMKRMEGGALNTVKDAGKMLGTALEVVNGGFENATRLAVYMAARDVGKSQAEAATMALNITVNFNRKGELGSAISSFYMFANASLQGSARMMTALRYKRVRRAVYMLTAASAALAIYNLLGGGDDDDTGQPLYERVPSYIRDKNFVLMWPKGFGHDGDYLARIPTSYGYSMFKVLGDRLAAVMLGKTSVTKAAYAMLHAAMDAFDPLGGDENLLAKFTPTILRPAVHLYTNKSWTGRPMYPEHDYDKGLPDSAKSFSTNSDFSKALTKKLNEATGGNSYQPGAIDLHPATVDEYLSTVTGGTGRFAKGTADMIFKGVTEGEWEASKTPILRRFFGGGVKTPEGDRAAYYEARQSANDMKERISRAKSDLKRGINVDESEKFINDHEGDRSEIAIFKDADRQMKRLRQQEVHITNDKALTDADRKAQIQDVRNQMRTVQNDARSQVRDLKMERRGQ